MGKRRHTKFSRYRERDSFSRRIQSSQCHCVNQGQTIGVSQTISSNMVTMSCLSYKISIGSCGARVVSGSIVRPVHVGANIVKTTDAKHRRQRERKSTSRTSAQSRSHSFLPTLRLMHRPRGREGGSSQERQMTAKARQHGKRCAELKYLGCVDRWNIMKRIRTNMQEHSDTLEDMRKWNALAARPTQYNLSKGQRENVAKSGNWYEQAVVGTKPPSPPITQSTALLSKWNRGLECHRRDPVHGRHRKTLSGLQARHHNLAVDELGRMVELKCVHQVLLKSRGVAQAHMVHVLLCVVSPTSSHRLARMSCFAPCLVHLYLLHSALRPLPLCFSLRTGPTPAPWTLVWPFCRTVSAHRPGRDRCVQGTSLCIFYGSCTGLHSVTSAWPGEDSLGWVGWCLAECFINQTG